MKYTVLALVALGLAAPVHAESHSIPQETVDAIMSMLTDMECQMDAGDIEMEDDGGFDLDDVICKGGQQYDIRLDADLNEVSRRAE
ncbi:PepSY domain-containing protein [Sagittula salina]|uniref:PepSY domain-containing protein n=1 Tax=Sagittula salina TaxID=2820268 RepID=A0A940MTE8_9RHOB|nr:PepSY domain-containing protein [Sagittula salina]MBP0484717.1 PepSY domain-containing protein [Sagittula salina]